MPQENHCVQKLSGGAMSGGAALQAGRLRFRFTVVSMEIFIEIILPTALCPWGRLSVEQKKIPGIFLRGKAGLVRRSDKFTTFMCRLTWNLGTSTSWNPQGLSKPVYWIALPIYSKLSRDFVNFSDKHRTANITFWNMKIVNMCCIMYHLSPFHRAKEMRRQAQRKILTLKCVMSNETRH